MKSKAPIIAGSIAIFLAIFKFIVGFLSGSMAVLSSGIDSLLDSLISIVNFLALKKSSQKPNEKFNFGYGKIEAIMAVLEGLIIILIASFIIYQSIQKALHPQEFSIDLAFFVMVISVIATIFLSIYLKKEAIRTKSLIIEADLLHYKSDLLNNLAIISALVIIHFTGIYIIDAAFGLFIGLYITFDAFKLVKDGIFMLLDVSIDKDIKEEILNIVKSQKDVIAIHNFRTRQSGNEIFLNLHLVFMDEISLLKAHQIGDLIEDKIKQNFKDFKWNIDFHFDPKNVSSNCATF